MVLRADDHRYYFLGKTKQTTVEGGRVWVRGGRTALRLNAGPINGLLIRCTLPTVVTVATTSLCGVISHMFVNRNMKTVTVSNLTVAFPFVGLATTFKTNINMKTSATVDIGLKRGSCTATRGVLNGAVSLGLVVNVKLDVVYLLFLSPVLEFFKTDSRALVCTRRCVIVVLLNGIIDRVCFNVGTLLQTTDGPGRTVCTAVFAIMVGIVLSTLFVLIFG